MDRTKDNNLVAAAIGVLLLGAVKEGDAERVGEAISVTKEAHHVHEQESSATEKEKELESIVSKKNTVVPKPRK
ncbi:hypothetical protein BU23DRAFT_556502 [Bimuria novae-zelandiae CBS 107.79]|uniref:Uncharacterized protein n=1 Tax=Bimuria novae-zelandiae CBS 107.79 TaxID=1447943 RepID=A0A6A5V045_9PLEO|nr:hypothetical protein BU23DRAFT_556502 [Bimuria novae-zelandiae CBS 107.79]